MAQATDPATVVGKVNPYGCPRWCAVDHAQQDKHTRYIAENGFTVINERVHSTPVGEVHNPGSGKVIHVDVTVTDDLDAGTREGPIVNAWGAECMDPDTARGLVRALAEAADLAASTGGAQ